MIGVIGGSGFEKFDAFETLKLMDRETPFGLASSGFKKVKIGTQEFLFISRHGDHHEHLPSEINYQANIFAMKMKPWSYPRDSLVPCREKNPCPEMPHQRKLVLQKRDISV